MDVITEEGLVAEQQTEKIQVEDLNQTREALTQAGIVSNAVTNNFQLWPVISVIVWFVIHIYMIWMYFRKKELDF